MKSRFAVVTCGLFLSIPALSAAGEEPAAAPASNDQTGGSLVAFGAIQGDGVESVTVLLQPGGEAWEDVGVGESVLTWEVPERFVSLAGGRYQVDIGPTEIPSGLVPDSGLVDVTVFVNDPEDPTNTVAGSAAATVRAVPTDAEGYSLEWQDPTMQPASTEQSGAQARQIGSAPSLAPPALDLVASPLSAAARSQRTASRQSTASVSSGITKKSIRSTTIGTTYPVGASKAWMTLKSGVGTKTGVAASTTSDSAGFYIDGTRTTDANFGFQWPRSDKKRSYRANIEYGRYAYCSTKEGYCYRWEWRPLRHTGGTGKNFLSSSPDFKKCENVTNGKWFRSNSDGKSYRLGFGVKIKSILGFDLSSERNYSSSNKLVYKVMGAKPKRMCGDDDLPSDAGKVQERFR